MKKNKTISFKTSGQRYEQEYDYIPREVVEEYEKIPTDPSETGNYYDKYTVKITSYRFEEYEDVQYCVLAFSTVEDYYGFTFQKYYPIIDGENDELLELLMATRTIRIYGNYIDFNALCECKFHFSFTEEDGDYIIKDLQFMEDILDDDIDFAVQAVSLRKMLFKGCVFGKVLFKTPILKEIRYDNLENLHFDKLLEESIFGI